VNSFVTAPTSDLAASEELVSDGLLSVKAAAGFLDISRSKLYELMDQGELAYVKIGKSRRIPRQALINLAAGNLVQR
jgi:excisionase family DNA binding protein